MSAMLCVLSGALWAFGVWASVGNIKGNISASTPILFLAASFGMATAAVAIGMWPS